MRDFSFQNLLDDFPASLVCQCPLVLPVHCIPGFVFALAAFRQSCSCLSRICFCPPCPRASCGVLFLRTSFFLDALLWAPV